MRRWLISPILACSTLPHSGHGYYVGPVEALAVVGLTHTIEQLNATAGSLFKCPFPALANRMGQLGDSSAKQISSRITQFLPFARQIV